MSANANSRRANPSQQIRDYRLTVVTGRLESASKATGLGLRPAETINEPSAATIAPLSVHSPGLGTRSWMPALSHRSWATARSLELAATPPAITSESIPDCLHAANAFSNSTSTIASWNEAATSARMLVGVCSMYRATAVFNPENEKSKNSTSNSFEF